MKPITKFGRPLWAIGSPIEHTLSPPMHNAAFERAGLDHHYFAMEVLPEELADFLDLFRSAGGLGASITLPLKQAVRERVPRQSEVVETLGAANTLYRTGAGELALDNTDVYGFRKMIQPWHDRVGEDPVLVLGAGGASRACLFALHDLGCPRLYLWNRTSSRARELAEEFASMPIEVLSDRDLESGRFEVRMVVNATSLGLEPGDSSPFPVDLVEPNMVGADVIYGRETRFMEAFRDRGEGVVGGMEMLVQQAAGAWKRWLDQRPDLEVMRRAFKRGLEVR